jgi:hypothetical protein
VSLHANGRQEGTPDVYASMDIASFDQLRKTPDGVGHIAYSSQRFHRIRGNSMLKQQKKQVFFSINYPSSWDGGISLTDIRASSILRHETITFPGILCKAELLIFSGH